MTSNENHSFVFDKIFKLDYLIKFMKTKKQHQIRHEIFDEK
jgi:hypothetical protein